MNNGKNGENYVILYSETMEMTEKLKEYDRIIMGIDPGTRVMGYGVLGIRGRKP